MRFAHARQNDSNNMETPLHLACKFGQVKAVRYLVSLGPKVRDSLLNIDGKRAIDIVCQKKCPLSGMCSVVSCTQHGLTCSRRAGTHAVSWRMHELARLL